MRFRIMLLTLAITVTVAPPAAADHENGHATVQAGLDMITGTTGGKGSGGGGGNAGGAGGTAQQVVNNQPIYDVGLGETGNGNPCWRIETGGSQTLGEAREMLNSFDNNGTLHDACPPGQRGPTLAERVQAQFESWSPNAVSAEMAPGYALTGLKGFLVISDPTPGSITLVGQTVTLSKEYRIRWGDGSSTTTTSKGVAYPGGEGEITHVYDNAGNVTVEIDLVVSGSWNGQNLGSLAPVTSTMPLEIWQVQAVRQR